MGGEMIFHHHIEKPINNLTVYEQLVQNIVTDCKNQVVPVEFNVDEPTKILKEKEKQMWARKPIVAQYYGIKYGREQTLGVDDDYIIGITLQEDMQGWFRNYRDAHYYILFPKDPNAFGVISSMYARAFQTGSGPKVKRWIHDYLTEFEKTFPGIFELKYYDGYDGYNDEYLLLLAQKSEDK